jgi:hypothetical protein
VADHTSLTLITTCWGDYWNRFGSKWLENVTLLNPQPAEILFISREDIELPDMPNLTHLIDETLGPDNWYTGYVRFAKYDWVTMFTLDDQMPLNGLKNLNLEGDVVVGPCMNLGDFQYHQCHIHQPGNYKEILELDFYPLTGWAMFKKEILLKIPSRPIDWEDWALFLEFRQHNVDVRIDNKIRNYYVHHAGQRSKNVSSDAKEKIFYLKQLLPTGRVIPGAEWPPRLRVSQEEKDILMKKSNGNIVVNLSDFMEIAEKHEKN